MRTKIFVTLLYSFCVLLYAKELKSQGIYVPAATGAWGNSLYTGVAITYPDVYRDKPGAIGAVGVGLGNPVKGIGCQISGNVLDPKTQSRFSFGFKVHKYAGKGVFLALGIENALSKTLSKGTDSPVSQYLSLTQNFMYVVPASNFFSRLSYTIGAGFGRFSSISPKDFSEGKGWSGITNLFPQDRKYGTFGFAALQFKISKNLAYTVEWSGINLNTGISFINEYTNDALILFPKSGNDEVSISIYDAKDFNNHIEVLSTEGKAVFMQDNVLFSEINFVKLSSLPVGDFLCKEVNGRIVMKKNSMIL